MLSISGMRVETCRLGQRAVLGALRKVQEERVQVIVRVLDNANRHAVKVSRVEG